MKLFLIMHNIEDLVLTRCLNTTWILRWIFIFIGMPLFIMSTVAVSVCLFSFILTVLGI